MICTRGTCGGRVLLDIEHNELFCLRCGNRNTDKGEHYDDIVKSVARSERVKNGLWNT